MGLDLEALRLAANAVDYVGAFRRFTAACVEAQRNPCARARLAAADAALDLGDTEQAIRMAEDLLRRGEFRVRALTLAGGALLVRALKSEGLAEAGLERVHQEPSQTIAQLEQALDYLQQARSAGSLGLDKLIQDAANFLVRVRRQRDPLRFMGGESEHSASEQGSA
jgi:hypothetical protein